MKTKYPPLWGESKWYRQKRISIIELVWVIVLWSIPMWLLFNEVK